MPLPRSAALRMPESGANPTNGSLGARELRVGEDPPQGEFEAALVMGLRREAGKEIPSGWLYDEVGSALFEAITRLPEYGLTRADERVIARCAPRLSDFVPPGAFVAELGSGSGRKTRAILEALSPSVHGRGHFAYAPIDVSPSALEACARDMETIEGLTVYPTVGAYLGGLANAMEQRQPGQSALLLFLGSTIGNFKRTEIAPFLGDLRAHLNEGDFLLLGADLDKAASVLELAYDDPAGVTAAFNRNLLGHINRSLGGDFHLHRFRHLAVYNRQERRIEMYLEATEAQQVWIEELNLRVSLHKGERILTEYSHKFRLDELRSYAKGAGFVVDEEWVDREWPFAECLWRAV
ncbi:MAG: L-histidine N(alpha)-methyltransferase [Bryobacterales bacterium]|nr:L-histidine N(alpha)-methyltransferase [Bryobacterales bacterium]